MSLRNCCTVATKRDSMPDYMTSNALYQGRKGAICWKEPAPKSSTAAIEPCNMPETIGCATAQCGTTRGRGAETLPN